MRNALAHAGRIGRRVVSAFIATACARDDAEQATAQWRRVADQLRAKLLKLTDMINHAEPDVLAYMSILEASPTAMDPLVGLPTARQTDRSGSGRETSY